MNESLKLSIKQTQLDTETHSDAAFLFGSSVTKSVATVFAGSEDPLC